MFKISLVHKYETGLYKGDYSHGTFFEGSIIVKSQKEVDDIVERFYDKGEIELNVAIQKYVSKEVSVNKTLLQFSNTDVYNNFKKAKYKRVKHVFGNGFVYYDEKYNYKYYYWLEMSKEIDPLMCKSSNSSVTMPVYHYSVTVCFNGRQITSMPVYVSMSDSCMDDDSFTDEINSIGPSGDFEHMLDKKLSALTIKMAKAINVADNTFEGILEYSFPIELVSSEPVDIEADYEHVE